MCDCVVHGCRFVTFMESRRRFQKERREIWVSLGQEQRGHVLIVVMKIWVFGLWAFQERDLVCLSGECLRRVTFMRILKHKESERQKG